MPHWNTGLKCVKRPVLAALLSVLAAHGQQYPSPRANKGDASAQPRPPVTQNSVGTPIVALGKRLFFDPRLSADERLSCASCHNPAHGFSDARVLSVGVLGRIAKRHTPTLIGRAFGASQFWDGRARTLEEQVLQPIANPDEMGMTVEGVLERLNQDDSYRNRTGRRLTREVLASALASYVRTVRSENAPLDRFLSGHADGLGDLELEGFRLFQDKARCYLCHSGRQFTDESFHNTGIAWREGALRDEGRASVDGKVYHNGAFKTPTLREIARRGPYMHDGSLATLEDVIDYYDRGGNQNPYLDENIVPLHLSDAEKRALLAFLRTGLAGSVVDGTAEEVRRHRPVREKSY